MPAELFEGIEAEGRLRGVPTLFMRGWDIDLFRRIVRRLEHQNCCHLMVGAGGYILTVRDLEEMERVMFEPQSSTKEAPLVTLHHPLTQAGQIPVTVCSTCHLLLYAPSIPAVLRGDVEIKLEDSKVALVYSNPVAVPLAYLYDRPVPPTAQEMPLSSDPANCPALTRIST